MPSISRMLADSTALTATFQAGVVLYAQIRVAVIFSNVVDDWQQNGSTVQAHSRTILTHVCGALQILFLVLVGVVNLDYDPVSHYWVAGLAGLFSLAYESLQFWRRVDADIFVASPGLAVYNGSLLFLLVVFMVCYAAISWTSDGMETSLWIGLFEYFVFQIIVYLPSFQLFDIGSHSGKECED